MSVSLSFLRVMHEEVVPVAMRIYPVRVILRPAIKSHVISIPVMISMPLEPFVPVSLGFLGVMHEEVVSVAMRIHPVRMILRPAFEPHMVSIPIMVSTPLEPLVSISLGFLGVMHEEVISVVMRIYPVRVILRPTLESHMISIVILS
jgi:hypothetical protein